MTYLRVPLLSREPLQGLDYTQIETAHTPTFSAHQMVVVVTRRVVFVALTSVAQVATAQEPDLFQRGQAAIDGDEITQRGVDAGVDFLGTERAMAGGEEF